MIGFVGDLISILNSSDVGYLLNKTMEDVAFIPLPEEIDSFYYKVKLTMSSDNYYGPVSIYFSIYARRNAFILKYPNHQTQNSNDDVILDNNKITFHYKTNDSLEYDIMEQQDSMARYTHSVRSFLRYRAIDYEIFTAGDKMEHSYDSFLRVEGSYNYLIYVAIVIILSLLAIRKLK